MDWRTAWMRWHPADRASRPATKLQYRVPLRAASPARSGQRFSQRLRRGIPIPQALGQRQSACRRPDYLAGVVCGVRMIAAELRSFAPSWPRRFGNWPTRANRRAWGGGSRNLNKPLPREVEALGRAPMSSRPLQASANPAGRAALEACGAEVPASQDPIPCKSCAKSGTGGSISFATGSETMAHTDFHLPAVPAHTDAHLPFQPGGYDHGELGARWITPTPRASTWSAMACATTVQTAAVSTTRCPRSASCTMTVSRTSRWYARANSARSCVVATNSAKPTSATANASCSCRWNCAAARACCSATTTASASAWCSPTS